VRSIRPEAFGLIAAFGIPPGLAGAANLDSLVPSASSGNNLGDNRVSIPLELSPGIAGVEPELALQYSSRAVVLHYDPVAPWRTLQAGIARTLARRVARIEVKVGTERIREYQIEYVNTRDSGFVLASIDVAGREGPLYPAPAPVEPLVSFGYSPDGWNWDSWSEGQPYCTARRPATTTPTGGTSCATTRPAM
jgi:hypothetical protein